MDREHNQQNTCQYCPPKSNELILTPGIKTKLTSFLGVCGCISCYVAMFPAILLGIIGIFGLSQSQTSSVLNAYMASALFQPILIISILFLIAGIFRYGKFSLWLSILGGVGIFISMNFYMHEWLFTLSFVSLALAYLLAFRQAKSSQLKFALVLLVVVVILGIVDIGRSVVTRNLALPQVSSQTKPADTNMMNMNGRR